MEANGRQTKNCLGQIFLYRLGCFAIMKKVNSSNDEYSAQVSPSLLKFVHAEADEIIYVGTFSRQPLEVGSIQAQ